MLYVLSWGASDMLRSSESAEVDIDVFGCIQATDIAGSQAI